MPEDQKKNGALDGWEIDLRCWTRKQLKEWEAKAKGGDDDAVIPYYALIIKRWPFKGDPADVAAYDEMNVVEWAEVNKRVGDALKSLGDSQ